MSGLYLHSPALEGMWMEALQEHTGKVCLRRDIHFCKLYAARAAAIFPMI
jgi:hypothetical protein